MILKILKADHVALKNPQIPSQDHSPCSTKYKSGYSEKGKEKKLSF